MPIVQADTAEQMNAEFSFDEASFLAKIPYKLTPTNLKGVYAHVGPPDDFDPNTATQRELIQHGILFRKPTANDPEHVRQAWDRFFSRKWLATDRIVPEFEVHVGRFHHLKQPPKKQTETSYLGNAWAGAGGKTGNWTSIVGSWTVPTVSQPSEPLGKQHGWNSSSWLGLDGFFVSDDVLQAGVGQIYYPQTGATYFAWYEWFAPAEAGSPPYIFEVGISNMPVKPGDLMSCAVQYVGTAAGSVSLANGTTGVHFSITLAPPPGAAFNGSSYEWIMEAPDGGEPNVSLPAFTPVVFTSAAACGPDNAYANPATGDTMNIEGASGQVLTSVTVGTGTVTIDFVG